ncbi:MAG: MlaD family protein [Actinomycetota bacterium]|nr:MlaD family protein [Actinomycetota bacterium]
MSNNRTRQAAGALLNNPIMVGTMTILVVLVAVYLSYIAENGLPFTPTYSLNVEVANAGQLIKNADVRIGGARVGQVLTISPEPATRSWPHPYARLGLSLQRNLQPLPADTHYRVRLASVLGGNYVELLPGHDRGRGVADGGTLTLSTNPRLDHNLAFVDLDSALAAFGPRTRHGLRGVLTGLGDTVAGRGAQFNDAIGGVRDLLGPARSLLSVLAHPQTRLAGFMHGLAGTTGALAPVAPVIDSLLAGSAMTFAALDRPALGLSLDQLPGTEAVASAVLARAEPVLGQAAGIVRALKPSAAILPLAAGRLDAIITSATPVFVRIPKLARALSGASGAIYALARDPASRQTFTVIGSSDLGTFGASAFIGLGATLQTVSAAQFHCNAAGLWVHNFGSALSEGDSSGSWLRFQPIFENSQTFASAAPASDLHLNYYPIENARQCQAGNEGYVPGRLIGNPPTTSNRVDNTAPPPGVLARGRRAGLVP